MLCAYCGARRRDQHPAATIRCSGAEQALYGLLAALVGLRLLGPQVAQQPVERLLVGVVLLPAREAADVAGPAQLYRPGLFCALNRGSPTIRGGKP